MNKISPWALHVLDLSTVPNRNCTRENQGGLAATAASRQRRFSIRCHTNGWLSRRPQFSLNGIDLYRQEANFNSAGSTAATQAPCAPTVCPNSCDFSDGTSGACIGCPAGGAVEHPAEFFCNNGKRFQVKGQQYTLPIDADDVHKTGVRLAVAANNEAAEHGKLVPDIIWNNCETALFPTGGNAAWTATTINEVFDARSLANCRESGGCAALETVRSKLNITARSVSGAALSYEMNAHSISTDPSGNLLNSVDLVSGMHLK